MLHWTAVPITLLTLGASVAYGVHWRRGVAPGRGRRAAAFAAAVVTLLVAMIGPLDWLGERRLMSAHMVQHLLLFAVVPAFVLGSFSLDRLGRRSRRWPPWAAIACLLAGLGVLWVSHMPPVLESGLTRPLMHDAQHVTLIAAGVLLAWPLSLSGPLIGFGAVAYLVVAELGVGVLGIWLAWYPSLIYESYASMPRLWGLDPQTDQSLSGAILLVVEEPFLAVEFAVLFVRAFGDSTVGG